MSEKIVIIGAGSRGFAEGIISDLIKLDWECEIALVDINPHALSVIKKLAEKMLQARPSPIKVTATTERRIVLAGATVIITTINVGGRRAWEQDVYIPRKYGIFAPVGDTTGPGGASRAIRMIPAMVEIAHDIAELAPNALFINYANPMAPICRAINWKTGLNVTGLCHGIIGDGIQHLSKMLNVGPDEIQFMASGYNHLTWFTDLRLHGEDLMPRLRQLAPQHIDQVMTDMDTDNGIKAHDFVFSWQLFEIFGAFPCVLDRHVTEFFPQFFRDGHYYGKVLGVDAFSFEGTIASGDREYEIMQTRSASEEPLGDAYFVERDDDHEEVMDIVAAIRHDRQRLFYANMPNTGQAPNLPLGAVVEGPAVVDTFGIRPLAQQPLPIGVTGTLVRLYQWCDLLVEAALEGSRDKFIQAMILDGSCDSIKTAVTLSDELLQAQAQYLPQFNLSR